jgi:hypothetical protein
MDTANQGCIANSDICEVLINNIDEALNIQPPTTPTVIPDKDSDNLSANTESAKNEETPLPPSIDISKDLIISSDEETTLKTNTHPITPKRPYTRIKKKKLKKVFKLRTLAAKAIGSPRQNIQLSQAPRPITDPNQVTTELLARAARQQGGVEHMPNITSLNLPLITPYKEETQGKRYIVAPKETRFLTHSWYHIGGTGTITAMSKLDLTSVSSSSSSNTSPISSRGVSPISSDTEDDQPPTIDKASNTDQPETSDTFTQVQVDTTDATTSVIIPQICDTATNTIHVDTADMGTNSPIFWQ